MPIYAGSLQQRDSLVVMMIPIPMIPMIPMIPIYSNDSNNSNDSNVLSEEVGPVTQ